MTTEVRVYIRHPTKYQSAVCLNAEDHTRLAGIALWYASVGYGVSYVQSELICVVSLNGPTQSQQDY